MLWCTAQCRDDLVPFVLTRRTSWPQKQKPKAGARQAPHRIALSAMHALTKSSAVSGREWKPICRNISLCCSESM